MPSKEQVLEAAKECPAAKQTLNILFPEYFVDNTFFCRIGSLLLRKGHAGVYAIFKWNGEVRILTITNNTIWKNTLKVNRLYNPDFITVSEFKTLMHYSGATIEEFESVTHIVQP